MSDEREGTPEDFARLVGGEPPEPEPPEPEQDTEQTTDKQVIGLFSHSPERHEAERLFVESLHKPYEGDDAA